MSEFKEKVSRREFLKLAGLCTLYIFMPKTTRKTKNKTSEREPTQGLTFNGTAAFNGNWKFSATSKTYQTYIPLVSNGE